MSKQDRLERRRRRAERIRAGGRRRFVWTYGVLVWGLTTGVVFALLMGFTQGKWAMAPLALVLFPLGGILWGRWMWKALGFGDGSPSDPHDS